MAENESIEGKDLVLQEQIKEQFEKIITKIINNMKNEQATITLNGETNINIDIRKEEDIYNIYLLGEKVASRNKQGEFSYNIEGLKNIKNKLENSKRPIARYEDLGLPDIEYLEHFEKEKNDRETQEKIEDEGDRDEIEKDDEKPELEGDSDKEEIAKKYNVNSNQVIHIAKDEKITQHQRFDGVANYAKYYDDIYIIRGKDPYSWKIIGVKEGKQEEIEEQGRQVGGKNPDIKIKRIDEDEITEVKPLAMYEIDDETSIAIVKDGQGRPEALYCRQEGGDEKTYWGVIIPEASGKNIMQESPDTREFIDGRNNSNEDLLKKAEELEKAKSLEERGAPSKEKGVQVYEIDGTHEQNRNLRKEEIVEDLMRRDGIIDRATVPPGFYENKAEKVLLLMEENEGIDYEEAIARVEAQNKRDEGGMTPDQKRNREGQ